MYTRQKKQQKKQRHPHPPKRCTSKHLDSAAVITNTHTRARVCNISTIQATHRHTDRHTHTHTLQQQPSLYLDCSQISGLKALSSGEKTIFHRSENRSKHRLAACRHRRTSPRVLPTVSELLQPPSSRGLDQKRSHFPLKINKPARRSAHAHNSRQRGCAERGCFFFLPYNLLLHLLETSKMLPFPP